MNHAERKALKRAEQEKPKYMMTADDIEKIRRDTQDEANRQLEDIKQKMKMEITNQAIQMLFSIPCLVLHDKFGFGPVRMQRFMESVQTWVKACNADPATLREVLAAAKEEAGYEVVFTE